MNYNRNRNVNSFNSLSQLILIFYRIQKFSRIFLTIRSLDTRHIICEIALEYHHRTNKVGGNTLQIVLSSFVLLPLCSWRSHTRLFTWACINKGSRFSVEHNQRSVFFDMDHFEPIHHLSIFNIVTISIIIIVIDTVNHKWNPLKRVV